MKRFLVFLVIAIAVTSLGLSIYYFSKDNEVIFINNTQISVNAGDTFKADGLLTFQNASKYTKVDYDGVQDESVLQFKEEGFYAAIAGGETKIVITTSNRAYSNLVVNVIVRDGTEAFPYIIDTEEELRLIGNDPANKFNKDTHYELGRSIILTEKWTPIAEFTGSIDGAGYTISNMDISAYTAAEIDATKIDNQGTLEDTEKTDAYNAYNASLTTINNVGLVGKLTANDDVVMGRISNLTLKNVNISGDFTNVGAIAGINEGEIRNCHVSTDSYVKLTYLNGAVVDESIVYNTIQSSNAVANIGGVAGVSVNFVKTINGITKSIAPIIERAGSSARIVINATSQAVGGVVGNIGSSQVSESMFDGYALEGAAGATFGGIVGKNSSTSPTTIIDCFAVVNTLDTAAVTDVAGVIYKNITTGNDRDHNIFGVYHTALRTYATDGTFTETAIPTIKAGKTDAAKNSSQKPQADLKTVDLYVSYQEVIDGQTYTRKWDFEHVWTMGENYPTINKASTTGSVYVIDYSNVKGANTYTQDDGAEAIYNALKNDPNGSVNIAGHINMAATPFEWIPIDEFAGTFTGTPFSDGNGGMVNPVISNLTIVIPDADANQGMFNKLADTAIINNLTFENVTIKAATSNTAATARWVGTLAGECNGAIVNNVSVKGVTVMGMTLKGFGGLIGYNDYYATHAVTNVSASTIRFVSTYATVAGGIAAINASIISGDERTNTYVVVNDMEVVANQIGGIAGCNYMTIKYAKASLTANLLSTNAQVFGATDFVQVGGIAAYNKNVGLISNVVASVNVTVDTVKDYSIYLGGVVGKNAGMVTYAHVHTTNITANKTYLVYAGGVAGQSEGVIFGSLVETTAIKASTTTVQKANESYVGGIVGRLYFSSSHAGSVSYTISKATSLEGFYVGGLVGYSYGSVESCYAQGTAIRGFYAGGLASVINSVVKDGNLLPTYDQGYVAGMYKYCYAHVTLENVNSTIDMSALSVADIYNSVATYDKGASAGIAVLVIYGSVVDNCYTLVSFVGKGVQASTTVSRECGNTNEEVKKVAYCGTIKNTIYTTKGISVGTEGAKHVPENELRPQEGTRYRVFEENGFDVDKWYCEDVGSLPAIAGLDAYVNQNNNVA